MSWSRLNDHLQRWYEDRICEAIEQRMCDIEVHRKLTTVEPTIITAIIPAGEWYIAYARDTIMDLTL